MLQLVLLLLLPAVLGTKRPQDKTPSHQHA